MDILTLQNTTGWTPKDMAGVKYGLKIKKQKALVKVLIMVATMIGLFLLSLANWSRLEQLAGNLVRSSQAAVDQRYVFIPQWWMEKYNLNLKQTTENLSMDHDSDGLHMFSEYVHGTDPLNPDTDNDGFVDGDEVANDYNPLGLGRTDTDGDGLPNYWETANGLDVLQDDTFKDMDEDNLSNKDEYFHLTDPQNSDTDLDGLTDYLEIVKGYDPTGQGRPRTLIEIAKIGIEAPVIWSESTQEAEIQKDLQKGVIRYPDEDTHGIPGRGGNLLITGHSSNYVWAKGDYNYIFKDLNKLEAGDKVFITMIQANGKQIGYAYEIYEKQIVKPDDQKLFLKTDEPMLTLVTCWPLYTNQKRLMLRGRLVI